VSFLGIKGENRGKGSKFWMVINMMVFGTKTRDKAMESCFLEMDQCMKECFQVENKKGKGK